MLAKPILFLLPKARNERERELEMELEMEIELEMIEMIDRDI